MLKNYFDFGNDDYHYYCYDIELDEYDIYQILYFLLLQRLKMMEINKMVQILKKLNNMANKNIGKEIVLSMVK